MNQVFVIFWLLFLFSSAAVAEQEIQTLEENFCANGTQQQLVNFFTDQQYVVFAQGKHLNGDGEISEYPNVLFLVSPDLEFFHLVTQKKTKNGKYKACIFTSAREVDYKFAAPIPELFPKKNREHLIFLNSIPKDSVCPETQSNCVPWAKWSHMIKQTYLFSAYLYSAKWKHDAYEEIIELKIEGKTIRPTSGALSQLARIKYAARLRNELGEEEDDREAGKKAYMDIYKQADHNLPLLMLMLADNRRWAVTVIDRKEGLVTTLIQGRDLELYPLPIRVYKNFLPSTQ